MACFTCSRTTVRTATSTSQQRIKKHWQLSDSDLQCEDRLRFIVGGRYGTDKRDAAGLAPTRWERCPWTSVIASRIFDWKVGTEYDASASAMLYATIPTGNKPGSYNEVPPISA